MHGQQQQQQQQQQEEQQQEQQRAKRWETAAKRLKFQWFVWRLSSDVCASLFPLLPKLAFSVSDLLRLPCLRTLLFSPLL
ncbi:hypothetical protein Emed_005692 [Eimeria media]